MKKTVTTAIALSVLGMSAYAQQSGDYPNPFDFKGDALGMTYEAFVKAHHEPGYFVMENACDSKGKCKVQKIWKMQMHCDAVVDSVSICSAPTKILNDVQVTAIYLFVNNKLTSIKVSIPSYVAINVVDSLSAKFGSPSKRLATQVLGLTSEWGNSSSYMYFSEKACIQYFGNGTKTDYLKEWRLQLETVRNNGECGSAAYPATLSDNRTSLLSFYQKTLLDGAVTTINKALDAAKAKAQTNL